MARRAIREASRERMATHAYCFTVMKNVKHC